MQDPAYLDVQRKLRPPEIQELVPSGGVVGPVYNSAQIVEDPHYRERGDILEVDDAELGHTRMLGGCAQVQRNPWLSRACWPPSR